MTMSHEVSSPVLIERKRGLSMTSSKPRSPVLIKRKNSESGRKKVAKIVCFALRWSIIVGCLVFVINGFVGTINKYMSKQTSISTTKNESATHVYPSVTFCPMLKDQMDIPLNVLNEPLMQRYVDEGYNQSVIMEEIMKHTWHLTEFLQAFTHPEHGDPFTGIHMLHDMSYWTMSVPHQRESGVCFTYDPPFSSQPGWWYGIRFGYFLPQYETLELKSNRLANIRTFIHEKGKFIYYSQADFPNSHLLDTSWLRHGQATNIAIRYGRTTSLDRNGSRCTNDESVMFHDCMDEFYSQQRGCQPPWHMKENSLLPPCTDLAHIRESFNRQGFGKENYERAFFSPIEASMKTNCTLPCISSTFVPEFSYEYLSFKDYLKSTDLSSEWVVHLWFENFVFTYQSEFVVCDWTCLIGEIGGNLGFFLGGSILGYIDIILDGWTRRL